MGEKSRKKSVEEISEEILEKELKRELEDKKKKEEERKRKEKEEAEKENLEEEVKEEIEEAIVEEKKVEEKIIEKNRKRFDRYEKVPEAAWEPKTELGEEVKSGKIKDIDEILDSGRIILEPEIVDSLMNVESDLISIGQSKGKFGGGKRRAWRQTQRKTKEGNVPTFSAMAVVGDKNGHIGVGMGKATETLPARDKAIRKAKLNLFKVILGDGNFDSAGQGNKSIPFKVEGKCGSVRLTLIPAAPGTGLVVGDQLKKVLRLAGIEDIYSKTFGRKRTSFNFVKACVEALKKTNPVYKK
jgi:small subunit ribosomal protein S5